MEGYHEGNPLIGLAYHRPVLLRETVEALEVSDGWYLDATLGDGGHSLEILRLGGKIFGIDQDPEALVRTRKRFESLNIDRNKYQLIQGNFRDLKNLIQQAEPGNLRFEGVMFDLGVSSLQLESPQRGFSFARSGPLDMRMDPRLKVKALDLINALNEGELDELFYKLGEEKYARALAKALVSARQVGISTTEDLAKLVEEVVGGRGKIHPATKIFQALRIAVNDELNALKEALPQALEVVKINGYIVVISFHSLEDRIAKFTFKAWESEGLGKALTKKPIVPSRAEVLENPRSRSAKLRVFKKYDYNKKI